MRLIFKADFSEQFPNRVLRGIRQYAQQSGSPWVVCKLPPSFGRKDGDFQGLLDWARKWEADIVVAPFSPGDPVEEFRKQGIVAIALDNVVPFTEIPNLTGDYHKMGEMAAERFIARGYRSFGFFGYRGICWSDGRRQGFVDCLEEHGFKDNYQEGRRIRTEALWSYDEEKLGYWLLSLPKPVGIMACDDTQANILLECCRTFGIEVPGQVSVIGVDNDEVLCTMTDPQLSSIDVDLESGGYALAAMAERMVKEPDYGGEDIVLHPIGLVTRKSSSITVTTDKAIQDVIKFIADNAEKRLQVTDVLKHIPMSRRSLEQRFQKATGLTVYEFISKMRIEIFAQKLLASNDPVATIAAQMDEPDSKSISRRFVSLKGCTPSEFRRQYLRKMGA